MEDQPEELAYLYNNTDDLILSVILANLVDFDDLPMEDGETLLTAVTDDHFDDLPMEDGETLLTAVTDDPEATQGPGPDPADTIPELIPGNATDTPVMLRELIPHLDENQEVAFFNIFWPFLRLLKP